MEKEKLPCDTHTEQIRTLFKQDEVINRRIDNIETKVDNMTDVKIAVTKISTSMDYLIGHVERQDKLNEKQNETLDKMNQNLNELNEGQKTLNNKVEKLEKGQENLSKRVDESEEKGKVDIIIWIKNLFIKHILPIGLGIGLIELIKKYL